MIWVNHPTPGKGGKSPSRSSSQERPESVNKPFVREGSLKAYKEEQDRIKAEEEEKLREAAEKRAKSAQKKVCMSVCKAVGRDLLLGGQKKFCKIFFNYTFISILFIS